MPKPRRVAKLADFKVQDNVGYLMKRCTALFDLLADATFRSQSFSFLHWLVLTMLHERSPRSATELSVEVSHDLGALTRILASLEQAGFIRRTRNRRDRRSLDITLDPAGLAAAEGALPLVLEDLNRLLEPFSKQELDTLVALLQKLLRSLETDLARRRDQNRTELDVGAGRDGHRAAG